MNGSLDMCSVTYIFYLHLSCQHRVGNSNINAKMSKTLCLIYHLTCEQEGTGGFHAVIELISSYCRTTIIFMYYSISKEALGGHDFGVDFASWMGFGMPVSLIMLFLCWIVVQLVFIGVRYV